MHKLVAFSTRWGAAFGGINSFNADLLKAVALGYDSRIKVWCVVPLASSEEREAARAVGVELIVAGCADAEFSANPALALGVAKGPVADAPTGPVAWLGHDRITGHLALEAAKALGGESVLIHHMSYDRYEAFCESSPQANQKNAIQRGMFSQAGKVMAVGPLLRDALRDMLALDAAPPMLVPGLPEIQPLQAPLNFRAYLSGRVSADTNKIKQAHLGVAAFSRTIKRAEDTAGLPDAIHHSREPKLCLRGLDVEAAGGDVSVDLAAAELDLRLFSEKYSDRAINLSALAFTPEREVLFDELRRSTVAMMPSWHEGFGLVAWEAIAAGVPLIVSEKSGVYQLLRETQDGLYTGMVRKIDVRGSVAEPFFHPKDVDNLADALIDVAKDIRSARAQAARLREGMASYTWSNCAETFVAAVGWSMPRGVLPVSVAPGSPPPVETKALPTPPSPTENWLATPARLWAPGCSLSDSHLLRAEEARVPFDSDAEPFLQEQLNWVADSEFDVSVRLITGVGGAGKTRLSLEMCRRLAEQGWASGFLKSDIDKGAYRKLLGDIESSRRPWFIVVDYAEARQDCLIELTKTLANHRLKHKVCILLLARDAGEWWDQLPSLDAVSQAILNGRATSGPFAMPQMHDSQDKRVRAFEKAVAVFCELLGVEAPGVVPDLSPPHFIFPLYVQMAALAALLGESTNSAEGLPRSLILHEERYWRLMAPAGKSEASFADIGRVVTLATIVGGLKDWKSAREIWERWVGTAPTELRAVFGLAAALYPDVERGGVLGIRPDLLGEALITKVLLSNEGVKLLEATLKLGTVPMRRHALATLTRILSRRPDLQHVVEDALAGNFLSCARETMEACLQTEGPLADIATRAFERLAPAIKLQCATVLAPMFSVEIVPLISFELALREVQVDGALKKLVKHPGDADRRIEYSDALHELSVSYARCGQYALGRDTAKKSMDAFFPLFSLNQTQYRAGWADCLMTYSGRLNEAGDDDALEYVMRALEIREQMERDHPGRFKGGLAVCQMNAANRLSEAGQHDEALERAGHAIRLFEELSRANKIDHANRLADAWHNQAALMVDAGQYAAAIALQLRTLEFYERAAKDKPESFESDLAMGLSNYGATLETLGDYPGSLSVVERATQIYETLARVKPTRFEAPWADGLAITATAMLNLGPDARALALLRKGVEIHRRGVVALPARYWLHFMLARTQEALIEWLLYPDCIPDMAVVEAELEPWAGKARDRDRGRFGLDWLKYCFNTSPQDEPTQIDAVRAAWSRLEKNAKNLEQTRWMIIVLFEAKHSQDTAVISRCRDEWGRFLDLCSGRLPWWMQETIRRKGLSDVFQERGQPEAVAVED